MNNQFIPPEVKERIRSDFKADLGDNTSRENGYLGGNLGGTMTRRLVEMAEKDLANKNNIR